MKVLGCKPLKLPENDATVTDTDKKNGLHEKIPYSLILGNELQLTPFGYRVYHAEFKSTANKDADNKDAANKDAANKDVDNKDIATKDAANKDVDNKDTANKGKANKYADNKNVDNRDTFKIVKDNSFCPNDKCNELRKLRIKEKKEKEKKEGKKEKAEEEKKYIYDENEVELSHCRKLHGQWEGMWNYVPAKLLIKTYLHRCNICGKPYRDSISDLRDGRKWYTKNLGAYIKTASLQSDLKQLSDKYFVNRKEVYRLYTEAVADRKAKSLVIPQPKSLGLYTLTFNKAGKTKRSYCLCIDVERQAFIGFFPWDDAEEKQKFFDSIPDIQQISTIFVSLDDNAAEEGIQLARKVNAKLAVERHSVLRQAHDAAELIYATVKKKQRNKYDKRFLDVSKKEFLYYDVKKWEESKSFLERYFEIKGFEKLRFAHGLNRIIYSLYHNNGGESYAEAIVDEWVRAWEPFKKQFPQMDEFSALLEKYKGEIAAFNSLCEQTPKALAEYEELLAAADNAIIMLASNGTTGAYAARNASVDYLYGHVMYGVVDRVNDERRRQYQMKKDTSIRKKATHFMVLNGESGKLIGTVENDAPELITNDNFSIPLREFCNGLSMMREYPVPEEISIDSSAT